MTSKCSFCGKPRAEVERLAAGLPSAFICNECLVLCRDIIGDEVDEPTVPQVPAWEPSEDELEELKRIGEELGEGELWRVPMVDGKLDMSRGTPVTRADAPRNRKPNLTCSFCGKSEADVRKLVAGPTVYICDECVGRLS